MNRILFIIPVLLFSIGLFAQDTLIVKNKSHSISLKLQFGQIKDQFNYGLVFSGGNIGGDYSFSKTTRSNTLIYNGGFTFGINNNIGSGVALRFKPVDFFYGHNFNYKLLVLGGYIETNYQFQLYPDLQSGHVFWFTAIEFGPQVLVDIPYKTRIIKFTLSTSLAGSTSRPEPSTETYFYSLNFFDNVFEASKGFKFNTINNFNHTNLEMELLNNKGKRLSFAYAFEYFGYYQEPKISVVNHTVFLKWKIGKQ